MKCSKENQKIKSGSSQLLAYALQEDLLSFSPRIEDNDNGGRILTKAGALLYLVLQIRRMVPGATRETCCNRAVAHLKHMVSPEGEAPFFDLGPYWSYCMLTAAIAVCHETPEIWEALTCREQEIYDFIMKCFAYVLALGTSDDNDYQTGPGMVGNFGKAYNPNYRLANVTPMLFIGHFFGGAAAVDRLLEEFDFDTTIAAFQEYGFTRALGQWTKQGPILPDGTRGPSAKQFMEQGGPAYLVKRYDTNAERLGNWEGKSAGTGVGVHTKYSYQGFTLEEPAEIFRNLLYYTYSGGAVVSSYGTYEDGTAKAYLLDGSTSPWEGQQGMMLEFACDDGGCGTGRDIRSSCSYCLHDFILVVASLAALQELELFDLSNGDNRELRELMQVGNADFLYKYQHGYMSYSTGRAYESHECEKDGFYFWKEWWLQKEF